MFTSRINRNEKANQGTFCLLRTFLFTYLVPFLICCFVINLPITLVYIVVHRNGDLISILADENWIVICLNAWKSVHWNHWYYPCWFICHLIWSFVSLTLLPSQQYAGPFTISGFHPHYKLNGIKYYIISMTYWIPIVLYFSVINLYLTLVTFIGYLTIFSLLISLILLFKGYFFPSPGVFDASGSVWIDFLEGIELYPRFGTNNAADCKIIFASRFSYFTWQLILLIAGKVSYEFYMTSYQRGQVNWSLWVVIILQTTYITKHYLWEKGFIGSIDVTQSKFGFIQCFKSMVWIPVINSVATIYLVKHGPAIEVFGFSQACIILVSGLVSITLIYVADLQKTIARSTNGRINFWLFKSNNILQVTYLDEDSQSQETTLLASGLWSIVRHPNYTFELTTALLWSLPACSFNPISYLYPGYLFIYLVHRSNWVHDQCCLKYGKQWEQYCKLVPYRLIPYFY